MLKKIILICFLTLPVLAFCSPTYVVLQYDYGNQITRSGVVVLSSGLVMQNRTLQGRTTRLPDQTLTQPEIDKLIQNVDASSLTSQLTIPGNPTQDGSPSGALYGNTSDGYLVLLFVDARAKSIGDKDTVTYQLGDHGKAARAFINGLVSDRMPLNLIGE